MCQQYTRHTKTMFSVADFKRPTDISLKVDLWKPSRGDQGMLRVLNTLSFAIAVTLATSIVTGTAALARPHSQMCKATGLTGKHSTWRCGASQKCCYVFVTGKGYCVPASKSCLLSMSSN